MGNAGTLKVSLTANTAQYDASLKQSAQNTQAFGASTEQTNARMRAFDGGTRQSSRQLTQFGRAAGAAGGEMGMFAAGLRLGPIGAFAAGIGIANHVLEQEAQYAKDATEKTARFFDEVSKRRLEAAGMRQTAPGARLEAAGRDVAAIRNERNDIIDNAREGPLMHPIEAIENWMSGGRMGAQKVARMRELSQQLKIVGQEQEWSQGRRPQELMHEMVHSLKAIHQAVGSRTSPVSNME